MKLIDEASDRGRDVLAWLLDRRRPERGRELLGDVFELYEERRVTKGSARAAVRAGWDVLTLAVRRQPIVPRTQIEPRRSTMARALDDIELHRRVAQAALGDHRA